MRSRNLPGRKGGLLNKWKVAQGKKTYWGGEGAWTEHGPQVNVVNSAILGWTAGAEEGAENLRLGRFSEEVT